jgi:heme exporter protein D
MQFQFESLLDFLVMDGHGMFVWSSYAITFCVLIVMVAIPAINKQRFYKRIQRHQRISIGRSYPIDVNKSTL